MSEPATGRRRIPSSVGLIGAVIALVPWFPYPGRIVADTKLDLVVDPWRYLARSQSAWDSHAFFGQLQNQAYGYLFPMGPFFGIGRSLDVPGWAVQRSWWTVVLLTAFVGTYLLCRRLGVGGQWGALVAAVAYALSPHALTVLGPISVEQWPSAVVPWLLLASLRLIEASGRARVHSAALVALACAGMGGVNATVTLAAIGVAGIFVLTAGRVGVRAFPAWCVGVVVGTAWWAVPLVVLGVYAFPFLDFIETSSITTSVTSVPNVLRGVSHWVAYAGGDWPAGTELATSDPALLATTAVAGLGLLGLALRRAWSPGAHVRTFAVVSLLLGTTCMGVAFGATSDVPFTSPFAGGARDLLDGSLAAFRNVHKLDAMVRLPVCLGLAALVEVAGRRAGARLPGAPSSCGSPWRRPCSSRSRPPPGRSSRRGPPPRASRSGGTGRPRRSTTWPPPRAAPRSSPRPRGSASSRGATSRRTRSSRWPVRRPCSATRSRSATPARSGSWTPSTGSCGAGGPSPVSSTCSGTWASPASSCRTTRCSTSATPRRIQGSWGPTTAPRAPCAPLV